MVLNQEVGGKVFNPVGNQRLSLERLKQWEALGYGMFIHFGMSTFDGEELSKGDKPSSYYSPSELDVDQWVRVARDAGMKYAVLTTKHVSGRHRRRIHQDMPKIRHHAGFLLLLLG